MKKILLTAFVLFAAGTIHAFDYGQKIRSSHSDVATGSNLPVMIASAPFQAVAVTVSSPAPGGLIVIYRSTAPTFTADIATLTKVHCDYFATDGKPTTISFFDVENTSYTYLQVIGNVQRTLYFRNIPPFPEYQDGRYKGFGSKYSGLR